MASAIQTNFRIRQSFGKIEQIIDIPNLIDIQKKSYEKFLQANVPPNERQDYRPAGRLPQRLPDPRLQRHERARVRRVHAREARSTTSTSAASAA